MAIHRVGPQPNQLPYRLPLGRVLVTIDDLEALMQLVARLGGSDGSEVQVHFDAGYFTEATDLPRLSLDESKRLSVRGQDLQVSLGPRQALAVGQRAHVEEIFRLWAYSRQLAKQRLQLRWYVQYYVSMLACLGVALVIYFLAIDVVRLDRQTSAVIFLIALAGISFLGIVGIVKATKRGVIDYPYDISPTAVIEAVTMREYRLRETNNRYPRASVIVAILAIVASTVVAVAGILVSLLNAP